MVVSDRTGDPVAIHTLEPHEVADDTNAVYLDMADPDGEPAAQVAAAYGVSTQVASEMIIWQGYVNEELKPLIEAWGDKVRPKRVS